MFPNVKAIVKTMLTIVNVILTSELVIIMLCRNLKYVQLKIFIKLCLTAKKCLWKTDDDEDDVLPVNEPKLRPKNSPRWTGHTIDNHWCKREVGEILGKLLVQKNRDVKPCPVMFRCKFIGTLFNWLTFSFFHKKWK